MRKLIVILLLSSTFNKSAQNLKKKLDNFINNIILIKMYLICLLVILFIIVAVVVAVIVVYCTCTRSDGLKLTGYRLGNEIDCWYKRACGENAKGLKFIQRGSEVHGFVEHLRNNPPAFVSHCCTLPSYHRMTKGNGVILYQYDAIKDTLPSFRKSLRKELDTYFGETAAYVPGECVLHCRLGDFMACNCPLGDTVLAPDHFLKAIHSFTPRPQSVAMVESGLSWTSSSKKVEESRRILDMIRSKLNAAGFNVRSVAGTPDEDFARMSYADYLVTGMGSFALAACVANTQGQVRTPAIGFLNPNDRPDLPAIPVERICHNWETFDAHPTSAKFSYTNKT